MPSPIHVQWWNRPGWGEFKALRGGIPSHWGYDTYTLPLATIYGTANNGVVRSKGYAAGGWGHYIDVYYPASAGRSDYYQRDAHMNEASGLRVGAKVGTGTALGRVGRTGNAAGIFWPSSQSPNGKELWHVHSQCYKSTYAAPSMLTDPLPLWGVTTAGGGFTPIPEPEPEYEMITLFNNDDPNDATRRAYYDGLNFELQSPTVSAQERQASRIVDVDQKTWDQLKANANRRRKALIADIVAAIPPSSGGATDLSPVLAVVDELRALIPTSFTGKLS